MAGPVLPHMPSNSDEAVMGLLAAAACLICRSAAFLASVFRFCAACTSAEMLFSQP